MNRWKPSIFKVSLSLRETIFRARFKRARRSASPPYSPAIFLATLLSLVAVARANEAVPLEVDEAVARAEADRIAAVQKAVPSVLAIFASGGQGGGSGVVISPDGYALTNFHVAKPCGNFMKCGMADGKLYDAVIVGIDPVGDVAMIKLFGRDDFPVAELADSDKVQVGETCFAIGNPFLLATDFYPSVSWGVVSGTHRYQYPAGTLLEYADCLQVDAAINPGNSGGPLFDGQGRLIGINGRGSFEKRGRVNVGVGYAISINQIKNFLGHLRSGRFLDHATLGAVASTSDDGRVLVNNILSDSDAYRRGLRYDDEIVAFAGRQIRSVNALKNALGIFPKGWRVPISYRRDGETHSTYVRLMGVHGEQELLAKVDGPPKNSRRPQLPRRRDGKQDDDKDPGEEPQPQPDRDVQEAVKTPIAAIAKQHFEARRGYANYYFNRANVDRIWKALSQRADLSKSLGNWTIVGETMSGGELIVNLGDKECEIDLPTLPTPSRISVVDGVDHALEPPGSGGFLAALYLWRKMLIGGPGHYGQVTYEGTAPLMEREGLFDVLYAVGSGVEARFYFDPADSALVAMEMWPTEGVDPCEIYFEDYRESDGRWMPQRFVVRHGDKLFDAFTLKELKFAE
ncbi:MAG: trypsin-like peptidase domain-containing protein [Pirellulales bacterium]|nr:trypsin-like peptidase domain-containing protein [Pirellulales bacterium]